MNELNLKAPAILRHIRMLETDWKSPMIDATGKQIEADIYSFNCATCGASLKYSMYNFNEVIYIYQVFLNTSSGYTSKEKAVFDIALDLHDEAVKHLKDSPSCLCKTYVAITWRALDDFLQSTRN